jgi:hypothetical protein
MSKLQNNKGYWFDSLLKYLLAAILITVPLYLKFPFITIPDTFVSIRLEDLLLAISGLILLFRILPNIKNFVSNKFNKTVLLFIAAGFLSLMSGLFITQTLSSNIGLLHWLRRIEYLIPFYLAIEVFRTQKELKTDFYFKILITVLFIIFVYGFGQKYLNWPIIVTQNEEYSKGVALRYIPGGHINSTFAGHYDLGTFLVMTLPIIISSFFILKSRYQRTIILIASFAGLWLLVNTASRISLVSYFVAVSISLLLIKKAKFIPIVIIVSLLFTSFSYNLRSRYLRIIEVTKEKVQEIISLDSYYIHAAEDSIIPERRAVEYTPTPTPVFEDRSTNIRLYVEWPRAVRAFIKNPLLGTGYSSISLATDNDYLRLLGEVGLLGFFSFILVLLSLIVIVLTKYPFVKNYSGTSLATVAGFAGSFPGILLNAVFIDVFEASKFAIMFWLFAGITAALTGHEKFNSKNFKD